ncbi:MAG: hypothetical protein GEV03_11955 [Streptosporangiales bacterium]|nr:hypothetical protein [Streptosporangiales bacterium]
MSALSPTLDLRRPLWAMLEAGAAFLPQALDERFRRRLRRETEAGPFERLPEEVGPYGVRQQAELLAVRGDMETYPAVGELRDELVRRVRDHGRGIEGLDRWHPNDVAVQRYPAGSLGISPHRDGKRHSYLVAVFTTGGSAPFALCRDRGGEVVEEWPTVPGSLVLLRGPGLAGVEDGRPFHTVGGPREGTRVSVTFRMDSGRVRSGRS